MVVEKRVLVSGQVENGCLEWHLYLDLPLGEGGADSSSFLALSTEPNQCLQVGGGNGEGMAIPNKHLKVSPRASTHPICRMHLNR